MFSDCLWQVFRRNPTMVLESFSLCYLFLAVRQGSGHRVKGSHDIISFFVLFLLAINSFCNAPQKKTLPKVVCFSSSCLVIMWPYRCG